MRKTETTARAHHLTHQTYFIDAYPNNTKNNTSRFFQVESQLRDNQGLLKKINTLKLVVFNRVKFIDSIIIIKKKNLPLTVSNNTILVSSILYLNQPDLLKSET